MASIRNEDGSKGQKVNSASASCGCGDTERVQQKDSNSVRAAAIALCLDVEELKRLLGKSESPDAKELRLRVAELQSENHMLRHELEQAKSSLKALGEFFVIKF